MNKQTEQMIESFKGVHAMNPWAGEHEILDEFSLSRTLFPNYSPVHAAWSYVRINNPEMYNIDSYGKKSMIYSGHVYIYHDGTAIFVTNVYVKNRKNPYEIMKAVFVRLGCKHDITRTEIGRCLHRETCSKCGYSSEVDTSD